MAARQNYSAGRQQYARRSSERNSASAQMYVYGNVVTKPAYEPRRHEKSPERPVKRTSRQVRRNRRQALDMKEENNTKYNAIMDSVNLDEIRDKAQTDLGMVYASPQQVVEYDNPATDYVKQYESIPEDGVLAQSDKNSK